MIIMFALRTFSGQEGFILRSEVFYVATEERADELEEKGLARRFDEPPPPPWMDEEPVQEEPMEETPVEEPVQEEPVEGEIMSPRVINVVDGTPNLSNQISEQLQTEGRAIPNQQHQTNNVWNENTYQQAEQRHFTGDPINDGTERTTEYRWLHREEDTEPQRLTRQVFHDTTVSQGEYQPYMVGGRPIQEVGVQPPNNNQGGRIYPDPSGIGYTFVGEPDPFEEVVQHLGNGWYQLPNGERVQGYETARDIFDHYTNIQGGE